MILDRLDIVADLDTNAQELNGSFVRFTGPTEIFNVNQIQRISFYLSYPNNVKRKGASESETPKVSLRQVANVCGTVCKR